LTTNIQSSWILAEQAVSSFFSRSE
jgi:hypothetical protein